MLERYTLACVLHRAAPAVSEPLRFGCLSQISAVRAEALQW